MKKKLLSMGLTVIIAMSTSLNAFASELTPDDLYNTFAYAKVLKQNINYATIVQYLDIEGLANYSKTIKNENPAYSESELNELLKAEIIREGIRLKIISTDRKIDTSRSKISLNSYGDLPIIKNKLGMNEKKVFNESLIKGVAVLLAGDTAMSYYKSYYSGGTDDNADAFRHSLWMALSSASVAGADYSRRFGIAHEDDFPSGVLARSMDLYNNNVGIEYGSTLADYAGHADLFYSIAFSTINNAVKNGEMRRFRGSDIGTLTYLVKTNSTGAKQ